MNIQLFVIIGGILIGFLILIFGILSLKKMKKDDKKSENVNQGAETHVESISDSLVDAEKVAPVSIDNSSLEAEKVEPVSVDNSPLETEKVESVSIDNSPLEAEKTSSLEPEADASNLLNEETTSENSVEAKVEENNSINEVLNDDVQLDNSSLDSDIVSKPSIETEEDFLQKKPEDSISAVKVDSMPADSTDNDKVEKLF